MPSIREPEQSNIDDSLMVHLFHRRPKSEDEGERPKSVHTPRSRYIRGGGSMEGVSAQSNQLPVVTCVCTLLFIRTSTSSQPKTPRFLRVRELLHFSISFLLLIAGILGTDSGRSQSNVRLWSTLERTVRLRSTVFVPPSLRSRSGRIGNRLRSFPVHRQPEVDIGESSQTWVGCLCLSVFSLDGIRLGSLPVVLRRA